MGRYRERRRVLRRRPPRERSIIDLGSGLKVLSLLRSFWQRAWGRYARQPGWRAFVTSQVYYAPYLSADSPHALIHHTGPYVGDGAALQIDLLNGLVAGRGPGIVWAPAGCGKSRFALEFARRIERAPHRYQVLFVRHDESAVREELPQLTRLKSLVLIVDDAHECPELVGLLAAACAQAAESAPIHLVCVTRTTGRADVVRAINNVYPPGVSQEVDLGRPSADSVRALIEKLLPSASPHHRDTIARFVRQSYFGAVLVCTVLRREAKFPQVFQRQDLRERICREPLRGAVEGVCSIEAALRALAVYAAWSPIPRVNEEARSLAAELSGIAPAVVDVLLERALTAGIFQQYGSGLVRPIPDLLGDLILEEACLDAMGKPTAFSSQFLGRLFEADPVGTVRNCTDIGQLFGAAEDIDLVSALVLSRAQTVRAEPKWDVMKLLQACHPLAVRRPKTVLEMISALEKRGIVRRNVAADTLYGIDSIEMESYGLLMRSSELDADIVPVALRLGRDLYVAARADPQSRERVQQVLEGDCRFEMGQGLSHAQAVVSTLRAWVSESDAAVATLAVSLSGRFLTLDVEGQQASGDTVTVLRSALNPVPKVWEIRNIAVDTLVRAFAHADVIVQCAAVGALQHYAVSQLPPERLPFGEWQPQLAREIDTISAAIAQRLRITNSLPLCAMAEQQAWNWWVQEMEALRRAADSFLESVPRSDAYRLWKALHADRLPTSPVTPPDLADLRARADFVASLGTVTEEQRTEAARSLFDEFGPRFSDAAAWRNLWRTVITQIPRVPLHPQAGAVIGEFVRREPEAVWSLLDEAEGDALAPLLPSLLVELGKQDRARRSRLIAQVRPGTRLEQALLRALWGSAEPDEAESALLARALESADAETRHRAAAALLTAGHLGRLSAFQTVFGAIANNPNDGALWELAIERFVAWGETVLPPRGIEPAEPLRAATADLMAVLQTQSTHLRWGYQRHTRQLAAAFAVFAIVQPHELEEWIRVTWGGARATTGDAWEDEVPLSFGRISEAMRLVKDSPTAAHWVETFAAWIERDPHLASLGALWLAELCSLEDAPVGDLAKRIAKHPTPPALNAFAELIQHQKSDRDFSEKAFGLLEVWAHDPGSYAVIEDAVVRALAYPSGGRRRGQSWPTHDRALAAIAARRARGVSSGLLLATLERAEREIRRAMTQQQAQDEEWEEVG